MADGRVWGPDRWIGSENLESFSLRIYRVSDSATYNLVLADGRYWWAFGSWSEVADYPLFFNELSGRFAAAELVWGAPTMGFSIGVQDQADFQDRSCLRLKISANEEWGIDWDNSTGVQPEWFGFAPGTTGTSQSDSNGVLRSPYSMSKVWCSTSEFGGRARRKDLGYFVRRDNSSELLIEAASVVWGRYHLRRWEYSYIPAAVVYPEQAEEANRAAHAHVVQGDPNFSFRAVWEALGDLEQLIVVHDLGQESGLTIPSDQWEIVQAIEGNWSRFEEVARFMDEDARDSYILSLPYLYLARRSTYGA